MKLTPAGLRVRPAEMEAARRALAPADRGALELAARRIREFHRRTLSASFTYRDASGMRLGQTVRPLRRVGIYVPGGQGAYPSTVLMNAIPARVAGVGEIVMVSPPSPAGDSKAVLAAAAIAGVDEFYRVGGAQAVAALAYGTRTIRAVDKIVGPGNAWVQTAKRMVYGAIDIDKMAGPSEVLVIADSVARAQWVAADLIAQAEHGSGDEAAVLLTPSRAVAERVAAAIEEALADLPRAAAVRRVFKRRGALVVVDNLEEAFALADRIAPEHLELDLKDAPRWLGRVRAAGAVFVGRVQSRAARRLSRGTQSRAAHRWRGAFRLAAGRVRLYRANQCNRGLGAHNRKTRTRGRAPRPHGGIRGPRAGGGVATGQQRRALRAARKFGGQRCTPRKVRQGEMKEPDSRRHKAAEALAGAS